MIVAGARATRVMSKLKVWVFLFLLYALKQGAVQGSFKMVYF